MAMIKEMKGWKVIRRDTRGSVSYFYQCKDIAVTYPINVKAVPKLKGSKLFFFKKQQDAIEFVNLYTNVDCLVVPCIARNVTQQKWMCNTTFKTDRILSFWSSKAKYRNDHKARVLKGTLFAESITCLE